MDTGHRQAIHGELPARARACRSGAAASANRRRPLTHPPRTSQSRKGLEPRAAALPNGIKGAKTFIFLYPPAPPHGP